MGRLAIAFLQEEKDLLLGCEIFWALSGFRTGGLGHVIQGSTMCGGFTTTMPAHAVDYVVQVSGSHLSTLCCIRLLIDPDYRKITATFARGLRVSLSDSFNTAMRNILGSRSRHTLLEVSSSFSAVRSNWMKRKEESWSLRGRIFKALRSGWL